MTTPTPVPPPMPAQPLEVPPTFQPQPPVPLPAYEQPVPQMQQAPPPVQVPEGGYAQRVVRIPMTKFTLPGLEDLWVDMRNPGLMAPSAVDDIATQLQGVSADQAETEEAKQAAYAAILALVRRWRMWDATSDDDVPPLLPEVPDVDTLQRAPLGVLVELGRAFQELQDPR